MGKHLCIVFPTWGHFYRLRNGSGESNSPSALAWVSPPTCQDPGPPRPGQGQPLGPSPPAALHGVSRGWQAAGRASGSRRAPHYVLVALGVSRATRRAPRQQGGLETPGPVSIGKQASQQDAAPRAPPAPAPSRRTHAARPRRSRTQLRTSSRALSGPLVAASMSRIHSKCFPARVTLTLGKSQKSVPRVVTGGRGHAIVTVFVRRW